MFGETLGQYVSRVMRQKGLSQRDVMLRAGEEITGSYISGIVSGKLNNLSVSKLKALARGLDESPIELFAAASGEAVPEANSQQSSGSAHLSVFLGLMQRVSDDRDLMEILQSLVLLEKRERKAVKETVETLTKAKQKPRRKKSV